MKPDQDPEIVNLQRYRQAAREKAAKAAKSAKRPAVSQSFLGSRPRAGLILALVVAVLAAMLVFGII